MPMIPNGKIGQSVFNDARIVRQTYVNVVPLFLRVLFKHVIQRINKVGFIPSSLHHLKK